MRSGLPGPWFFLPLRIRFRSGETPDELQDRLRVPDATDRRTAAHLKPSESEAAGSLRGELFFGFMYPVSFIFMTSCALYIR